jgi:hypothetical protein
MLSAGYCEMETAGTWYGELLDDAEEVLRLG